MNLPLIKSTPPNESNVCGLVITHNPPQTLADNVQRLSVQIPHLILVDNNSDGYSLPQIAKVAARGVEVIYNSSNRGVAAALNQGLHRAREIGYAWIITLDQDSQPAPDLVDQLCVAYSKATNQWSICIVAPQIINLELDKRTYYLRPYLGPLYIRVYCHGEDLDSVTTVITSGSLINLDIFEALGGFREDFFIDYVDTEYCLRALGRGYRIVVACKAKINHVLGSRRMVKLGGITLYPTFHPPERWYYMSRNRIAMLRMYAMRFPHWFTYEIIASMYTSLRMLLTEDRRLEKMRAIIEGIMDGVRGKMGKRV